MPMITVLDDAPLGEPAYSHLEGVVDFLLAHGNSLAHSYRWGSNREGYFCHLTGPIDFDELTANFNFPKTVMLIRHRNMISCERTGCLIEGRS